MTDVMKGVRILEVAEHTFVPSASAVLADWGAEVIKIEHAVRGDAMRGLARTGVIDLSKGVHVLNEHSNRGKRSLGLDLNNPAGREVLYALARTCDVFLTNKLPGVLARLGIDVADLRKHNPKIIYVRGMTIAGGIAAALFKRERTGEPSVVDVSLLAMGAWAMSAAIALSIQMKRPWAMPPGGGGLFNPLVNTYATSDGRYISLVMLQAGKYWVDFCEHIDRPELAKDPRFDTAEKLAANAAQAVPILREVFAKRTLAEWSACFKTLAGQWAPVQHTLEVAADPQVRANGYIATATTREGTPFELVSTPVQFDEQPTPTSRAPEFNEHGDEILQELGYDMDRILELKAAGAVT